MGDSDNEHGPAWSIFISLLDIWQLWKVKVTFVLIK